ncbi:MAG: hypothetical protein LUD38_07565 [Parabacteroides sp.]|nr:hypothetical protein [Parabacteroides sp.]
MIVKYISIEKNLMRFISLLNTQACGDKCRTAGADHEPDGTQSHNQWQDQIDGGKRRFAYEIRDKKPVHNAIKRYENHHGYGWKDEPKQRFIGKMI